MVISTTITPPLIRLVICSLVLSLSSAQAAESAKHASAFKKRVAGCVVALVAVATYFSLKDSGPEQSNHSEVSAQESSRAKNDSAARTHTPSVESSPDPLQPENGSERIDVSALTSIGDLRAKLSESSLTARQSNQVVEDFLNQFQNSWARQNNQLDKVSDSAELSKQMAEAMRDFLEVMFFEPRVTMEDDQGQWPHIRLSQDAENKSSMLIVNYPPNFVRDQALNMTAESIARIAGSMGASATSSDFGESPLQTVIAGQLESLAQKISRQGDTTADVEALAHLWQAEINQGLPMTLPPFMKIEQWGDEMIVRMLIIRDSFPFSVMITPDQVTAEREQGDRFVVTNEDISWHFSFPLGPNQSGGRPLTIAP